MGNKIVGYILAGLGLLVMLLSYARDKILNFLPASIDKSDVFVTGIVIVVIGVVLLYNKQRHGGKVKQSHEEVPIYEGEGKNRKIVAYKKEAKK